MSYGDRIARLMIELDDWRPVIWRRVEVPLTSSLKAVHDVVQAVMPFEDYHLFEFHAAPSLIAASRNSPIPMTSAKTGDTPSLSRSSWMPLLALTTPGTSTVPDAARRRMLAGYLASNSS